MSLTNRPLPLYPTPQRPNCPICGHASYSASGVHPQCQVRKADEERLQQKRDHVGAASRAKPEGLSPWQKICPRCKAIVHVRKQLCQCGYQMARRR